MPKWREITVLEAFQHASTRQPVVEKEIYYEPGVKIGDGCTEIKFTDGSAIRLHRYDGFDYSEHTWESGYIQVEVTVDA